MRSVSARLAALFVLVATAILGVFSVSLYVWVRDGLSRDLDRQLQYHARLIQDSLASGTSLREMLLGPEVGAEVRGADGRLLAASEGWIPARPGWRGVWVPATGPGAESLRVGVGISEASIDRTLRELRLYFAVFCPLVLAIAGLLGYLFVRRALSPVEEIRRQAERISQANLSERVPEPDAPGEFRDLARTFNEMMERLERAIQDLQGFAADAAHELRTPLANLRAEIETAIQDPLPPDETQRLLGSVLEEVSRMSHVVADLFTLARIDLRQYAFRKERVALRPLLEEARDVWGPPAAQRGIEIRVDSREVDLPGDPGVLRRVFMNLVENAVKYNRDGGQITLTAERAGPRVLVRVSDTGIGIPPEHLPRLFTRFYRIDKARSRESGGSGLGLALCKSFVEAHEGRIGVESQEGRGTTITVDLPAEDS